MIRVDLHTHTSASSDCSVAPEVMARRARQLGLGPVFITDHNTIDGALERWRADPEGTVIGQEVMTTEGELIGLFLAEPIPQGLRPEETVLRIKAQEGLVYLEHPYHVGRRHLSEAAIERLGDRIDIVEVFNGRSDAEANRRADDLCAILGATPGAGSDAHSLNELGAVYIEMEEFTGAKDFLAKLRNGTIVTRPNRTMMRTRAAWKAIRR